MAKLVGSTLQTVIASESLPADKQFKAYRVFVTKEEVIYLLDNLNNNRRILCINPAESLEPVVVGQFPAEGRSFLTDLFVTDGGTIYVAAGDQRKVFAFHPSSPNFHRSAAVPRWIAPCRTAGSGQVLVCEHAGAEVGCTVPGHWGALRILVTSGDSASVKTSPAVPGGFQGALVW